jgi:hypothetical protein
MLINLKLLYFSRFRTLHVDAHDLKKNEAGVGTEVQWWWEVDLYIISV